MMRFFVVILTAVVALSAGQKKCQTTETLQETAGKSITLNIDADVKNLLTSRLSGSDEQPIVQFEDGKLIEGDPQKFLLDLKTRALTILSLSANDTGFYQAQTLNGKGPFCFNLTVMEAKQYFHENLRANQRNHYAAVVSAGLFVLTCIVLLAVFIMRKC